MDIIDQPNEDLREDIRDAVDNLHLTYDMTRAEDRREAFVDLCVLFPQVATTTLRASLA